MRRNRQCLLAVVAAIVLSPALGRAEMPGPASNPSARGAVESAMQDVLAILRNQSLTAADKRHKVRDIAYERMDFETLSRLSIGRNWRELSEAQRKEFISEFRTHMAVTYGHSIDRYTDEDIRVTGDRKEPNGDWTVPTTVGKPEGGSQDTVRVDYRLRQKDNQWKVIDVTIDGVSMVANFRSQFQDIIANGGIDRLLKLLREKNATAEK